MTTSTPEGNNGNGADQGYQSLASAPSPVENIPETAPVVMTANFLEYINNLENRVKHLEAEQARFTNALIQAGKFLFENPASKMMLAAFPKEMQTKLKEFFSANSNHAQTR